LAPRKEEEVCALRRLTRIAAITYGRTHDQVTFYIPILSIFGVYLNSNPSHIRDLTYGIRETSNLSIRDINIRVVKFIIYSLSIFPRTTSSWAAHRRATATSAMATCRRSFAIWTLTVAKTSLQHNGAPKACMRLAISWLPIAKLLDQRVET
jgi:hypothetical protein